MDDMDLLREYARRASDEAFSGLVTRHLDLVYSAALRQVRSPQLAEEVAQSVFSDLARNAARLKPDTILTAWLYQVTRRTAIDVVRREASRQLREQIATEMNAMNATAADWTHIEPLLDEAMLALDDTDRTAVLLRYFENKSLREVGATLGTSENAAQKRLARAVERLRDFFTKRGVTVGVSGLVVVISANAVQAAPVGLAVTISTTAVSAGATITATASAATIKTIAMTTLQKALITATIIAVGVATPLVIQHRAKLENARKLSAQSQQPAPISAIASSENVFPRESWTFKGYATPESALVSLVWAAVNSDVEGFLNSLSPEQQSRVRLRWQRQGLGADEAQIRRSISNQFGPIKTIRVLNKEVLSENEVILRLQMEGEKGGTGTVGKKAQRIGNEWKIGATL
jgi:RNA polymerase sigma factor (sigma-70 family)